MNESSLVQTLVGKKVLLTTDWFYAPNGLQCRAVHGTLRGVRTAEDTLGIKPNGKSANWYVEIGAMVIAGCQVNYAIACDEVHAGPVQAFDTHEGKFVVSERPGTIFITD